MREYTRTPTRGYLLIIGCAREEELPQTHPLRTLLLHLRTSLRVTELTLQPLDAAETTKLASQVANHELDVDEGCTYFMRPRDIHC